MGKKIKLTIGGVGFKGELNESKTADEVWKNLPIKARGNPWGSEIYFSIPVRTGGENPKEVVERGDLAYWPPGNAFCIFWGPTPVSRGDECRPASPVNVFGKITSDLSPLDSISSTDVVVEKDE
jgi:hypothetical protein